MTTVSATSYEQSFVTLYSSLFLESISPGPYAIIENSHGTPFSLPVVPTVALPHSPAGIIVGELVGDGVTVEMLGTASGNLTLCIVLRDDLALDGRFPFPAFAEP
jgi:hypothetical protein